MSFLNRLLHRSRSVPAEQAGQLVSHLITQVLQDYRFLGELLMQLPRRFDPKQSAVMELVWQQSQLELVINPQRLVAIRQDEACLLLEHEALHVAWQHPLRYAHALHPAMVKVATDVAVNQYLTEAPAGTATLAQLRRLLRKPLPAHLDSQDYLRILEKTTVNEREKLRRGGIDLDGQQKGDAKGQGESHQGWRLGENGNTAQQSRLLKLQQIIQRAWQQTPHRDRGILPGGVKALLQVSIPAVRRVPWRLILRQQLGMISAGKRESHARFNRRQPLRLDLPGQVTRLVAEIMIFVDNSGSMADTEIARAIAEIRQIAQDYRAPVKCFSFDTRVHEYYRIGQPERQGGGGTSFQGIFDYLRDHHVARTTIIMIITDGWGEKTINDHRYHNVYWLLTTEHSQLSVQAPSSRIFELQEGR